MRDDAALFVVVEHYRIREGIIDVSVDEGLTDADADEAHLEERPDDLETIGGRSSPNIDSQPTSMGRVAGPALLRLPGLRTIGAVKDERDTGSLTCLVERSHKAWRHILEGAGWSAFIELLFCEVFTLYHWNLF